MKIKTLIVFTLTALASLISAPSFAEHSLTHLRCEDLENPINVVAEKPRFSWQTLSKEESFLQEAYQIIVSDNEQDINDGKGNVWDSKKVSSDASLFVEYGGQKLLPETKYYWRVRTWGNKGKASPFSRVQTFQTALTTNDWGGAKFIVYEKDRKDEILTTGLHGMTENVQQKYGDKTPGKYTLPEFRRAFNVSKPVKRATAYVVGLGQFNFYANGSKVGDHFLDPGWTKYDKQALYVTFDITKMLRQGENVIGANLGGGFFNIPRERYFKILQSYGAPCLKAKISIEYADGTKDVIVTDSKWKTTPSPITYSSTYGGEDYNANLEQTGWNAPGFNDSSWKSAIETSRNVKLVSQADAPVRVQTQILPQRIFKNSLGHWIYDLGQNFSGIVSVKVKATNSSALTLQPSELIRDDKTIDQGPSGTPNLWIFTPKANSEETWAPQFCYSGFRYVDLTGAVPAGQENPDGLPEIEELVGLHTTYDAEATGDFNCSNPLFNKIYSLIDWSVQNNTQSVSTDCPHREKLGWLEQDHLMYNSISYAYNDMLLYEKILRDIVDSQQDNGMVPTIAPAYIIFVTDFGDTPEWGITSVLVPWYTYQRFGDRRILEENYPTMKRFVDYLTSRAKDNIVSYGLGDWCDIGPNGIGYPQNTPIPLTATATYYYSAKVFSQIADVLGNSADKEKYAALADEIQKSFNAKFWDASTKQYERNSQAGNAIAMNYGLVPEENKAVVLQNIINDIRTRGNAVTCGEVGYSSLIPTLYKNGASNVLYDMNSRYDVPGYGYNILSGETCMTESWQAAWGLSHDHLMLGQIWDWFYGGLAGILPAEDEVAYKKIEIRPQILPQLSRVEANFKSPYGLISSKWNNSSDKLALSVAIPANATAKVFVPAASADNVVVDGTPLKEIKDSKYSQQGNCVVVEVGSGNYLFEVDK